MPWLPQLAVWILLAVTAPCLAEPDHAFLARELRQNLESADLTALVRVLGTREQRDIHSDDGRGGYVAFTIQAEVIEIFVGPDVPYIEWSEVHEAPSRGRPPGEYIISLNRTPEGGYVLADEAGLAIPATEGLLAIARDATR